MKHKIIETNLESYPVVAVNVSSDETDGSEPYIEITAWHENANVRRFQYEQIKLANLALCEKFVEDFSTGSALIFADSFQ